MTSIGENEIGEHERIWLIYDKDADEPITWSSTPNPYEPFDETPDAAVEYVRADKLESLSERICELERALRIRIWNECKSAGMRDADAYKRINEEIAALAHPEGISRDD
jgi:hypothetical protein